jgi:hypothetical protein
MAAYTPHDLKFHLIQVSNQTTEPDNTYIDIKQQIATLTALNSIEHIHMIRALEESLHKQTTHTTVVPYDRLCRSLFPLKPDVYTDQNIIYASLFNVSSKHSEQINDVTCRTCKVKYITNKRESEKYCPHCGYTLRVFDDSVETQQNDELTRRQDYKRLPLYNRFIQQYNTDIPVVPNKVYDIILRELFRVHSFSRTKCRPTPVMTILRKHNLCYWLPYTLKICRILNADRQDVYLPDEVIAQLVYRFEELILIFEDMKKEKFLNYEFLTHQMLLMDGHTDHATLFKCHKTATVYIRSMSRLKTLCEVLQYKETKYVWFTPPQIYNIQATPSV